MHKPRTLLACASALAALLLAGGCSDQRGSTAAAVTQTKFPGQLAAGGLGSGEIMQRSDSTSIKSSMPSGTPGIPEGAGGTTSGPGMGGTTPNASVSGEAPEGKMQGEVAVGGDPARAAAANTPPTRPAGESAAADPAATGPAQTDAARKAAQAQQEKEELVASMDEVARRWRAEAAKNDWPTHPPTPVAAVAGITSSNTQEQNRNAPPVRSEKQGDAAPSEDVKKPKEPGAK